MGSRINKACDGCRFRKVKCSGAMPCSQCAHLHLSCVFSPPAGKRKPGVRGRLVAQLRENPQARVPAQSQTHQPQSSASPTSPQSNCSAPSVTSVAGIIHAENDGPSSYLDSDGHGGNPYSIEFFLKLVPKFENMVYPVNPIITPDEIRVAITTMNESHEDAALVYAFAAATVNLTKTSWHLDGDVSAQMTDLMQRSLVAHRKADFSVEGGKLGELPVSVKRISTCIFLEITMMAFKRYDRSFAILREAISMIQTLRVYQYTLEDATIDRREMARRQRLYWEAYIHERFQVIMSGYSVSLTPLSTGLPLDDVSIPSNVNLGFRRLIRLFQIMDDEFLQHWYWQHDRAREVPEMTAEWIERKQAELDRDEYELVQDEERQRAAGGSPLTELQHADLFVTRLWLRTLVWQLALSRGLLRSMPPENTHQGLSLHFPAERLSAQLRSLVSRLDSVASIGVHGSSILQKLFEITSTVADVCALPPGHTHTHEDVKARMEDFIFLVSFLFKFERVPKSGRDYLREKVEVLQQLYTVVDFEAIATSPL